MNRFYSKPLGSNSFEVINAKSEHLTEAVAAKKGSFHVHTGWFDSLTKNKRRLTNLNIDVADVNVGTKSEKRDGIGILSMAQIDCFNATVTDPAVDLDELHAYLKSMLANLLSPEAANRISLWKE